MNHRLAIIGMGLAATLMFSMAADVGTVEAQLTPTENSCRDRVAKLARNSAFRNFIARQGCIRRTIHGALDPTVNCLEDPEELGGAGTGDLSTDRRLADLAFIKEKGGAALTKRCDHPNGDLDVDPVDVGLDDICPTPATTWQEVADCAVDLGTRASKDVLSVINLDALGPLPASHLDCVKEVHRQVRVALSGLSIWRAKCHKTDAGEGILDCGATVMPFGTVDPTGSAKADKRLGSPIPRLERILKPKCDLPIDEIGYSASVPDFYTGQRFLDRVTLDDLIHALNDRINQAVYTISFGDAVTDGVFEAPGGANDGNCGDGVQQAGEMCDDGNNISCDGCDRDCTLTSVCGNGASCAANNEECDDGNAVSGDGCSALCQSELCGNGAVNPGYNEECDDGFETPTCDVDCTFAICGDGENNASRGEVCDTGGGAPANSATCDSDCTAPFCLDGHVNPLNVSFGAVTPIGEECDDGMETTTCDVNCTVASCGDGDLNPTRGEVCEDGDNDDSDGCVSSDTVVGSNCQPAFCGDGFLCTDIVTCPGSVAEACDDGTGVPGSAESVNCNVDCTALSCGDGLVNATAGETCDDAGLNGPNQPCVDNGGALVCVDAECGDGELCTAAGCTTGPSGGIEACDDGNEINIDSCRNNCAVAACGDGVVCSEPTTCVSGPGAGPEECDDAGESGACDVDCSVATCGDGMLNVTAGEICDESGDTDDCDSNCTAASCGDGDLNPNNTDAGATAAGELCDDGNLVDTDRCRANCTVASCGDGVVCSDGACNTAGLGPEQCDTSGESGTCNQDCTNALCGDGKVNPQNTTAPATGIGEECDGDGNGSGGETAGCDANCTVALCGDGTTNATAGEACDDGDVDDNDPCPSGPAGACLAAASCGDSITCSDASCTSGPSSGPEDCDDGAESAICDADCSSAICGDGTLNVTAGEACDDGDMDDNDNCPSGGVGMCAAAATCGDSIVCSDAACNTAGLGPETCDTGGESAGCDANCTAAVCGDGTLNVTAGEGCDDGDMSNDDNCPDGVAGSCVAATCGDGFTCSDGACTTGPAAGPEGCDSGANNGAGEGFCTSDCGVIQTCGNGTIEGTEECDDSNLTAADGCSSTCQTEYFVFQSSATYTPGTDFTNLATADALCNALAAGSSNPAISSGTFAAWLSDGASSPSGRFSAGVLAAAGEFYLEDGTKVADDYADFSDGTLDAPISLDENGAAPAAGTSDCTVILGQDGVWSNTTPAGGVAGADHCSGWSTGGGGFNARLGNGASAGNPAWSNSCFAATPQCGRAENLYCVEQ